MPVGIEIEDAGHAGFAAHIRNYAIHPRLAKESVVEIPVDAVFPEAFVVVDSQVEQQHLVVGHAAHKGLQRGAVPDVALIAEHPALHHPHGVAVAGFD